MYLSLFLLIFAWVFMIAFNLHSVFPFLGEGCFLQLSLQILPFSSATGEILSLVDSALFLVSLLIFCSIFLLLLGVLGLRGCRLAFSSCSKWRPCPAALRRLLLSQSTGSRHTGSSRCSLPAQACRLQQLCHMGLAAPAARGIFPGPGIRHVHCMAVNS